MGMVHAYQKGELKNPSSKVKEVAKHISAQDAKDFAATKHKGLPEKKSAMNNSTILERAAILMWVAKEAQVPANADLQPLIDAIRYSSRPNAAATIAGMLTMPVLTGGTRALMETDADKAKGRSRWERFGRGAVYGAAVPLGAQLGGAAGLGGGAALGAASGIPLGPAGMGLGAAGGGLVGGAAGAGTGGYLTYRLLKKLLGD